LKGKTIIITGASGGIGAASAELLAREGATLILSARRKSALDEVAAKCGERAHVIVADVTDRSQVRTLISESIQHAGKIDVLINNAGQGITRVPTQLTDEDIDEMMRVNVSSALYGMQEILPHFKERNEGHVINISSMLGRLPYAVIRSSYTGAKHFLNALTAMFREEVQQTHPGIQFSLVSPGVVRTSFGANAVHGGPDSHSMPNSQSPEEIAAVIADVIRTRKPDVYTRAGARSRVMDYYASVGTDP
jgi:NADP-dependent 3-hydroxy acid dehydrogenase YdfG